MIKSRVCFYGFRSLRASPPCRCLMSCTEGLAKYEGSAGRLLRLHPNHTPGSDPRWASPTLIPVPTFFSALSGLSLNSLTILSFCKNPELRTPTHLLVLSLALADSGISMNALVAATSSLLRYQLPPQSLGSWVLPGTSPLGTGQPDQRLSSCQ